MSEFLWGGGIAAGLALLLILALMFFSKDDPKGPRG